MRRNSVTTWAAPAALLSAAVALITFVLCGLAFSRDDGRYAGSKLKPWFDELRDKTGQQCCADADGAIVKDVDWTAQGEGQKCQRMPALSFSEEAKEYEGTYCVRYKNEWWLIPERALIEGPNRFGPTVIWPVCSSKHSVSGADACKDEESKLLFIRCFIRGAMG